MNFNNFCTNFFNIGNNKTQIIIIKYGLNKKRLSLKKKKNLQKSIENFILTNNEHKDVLLKGLSLKKKKMVDNLSYKGYRIIRGLTLNRQRTKTNSRTVRRLRN
uniref:Ribosomal protein S13 n=1 Tax=Paramoeba aparasomata TaxID=2583407 RepID=A0A5P8HBK1_9EUKA|nr:hypothetical protein [Paramoeba aparasomata]